VLKDFQCRGSAIGRHLHFVKINHYYRNARCYNKKKREIRTKTGKAQRIKKVPEREKRLNKINTYKEIEDTKEQGT
jgi:hypothetical protein